MFEDLNQGLHIDSLPIYDWPTTTVTFPPAKTLSLQIYFWYVKLL